MSPVPAPMKAHDLTGLIAWGKARPFAGIRRCLAPGWVAEPKYDGCRATLHLLAGRSRFAGTRSASFPHLAAISVPGLEGTILDGEFMAGTAPGEDRPPHGRTAGWFNSGQQRAKAYEMMFGRPAFVVFDLLALAGTDCTGNTYADRRRALEQVAARILDANPGCGLVLAPQMPASAATISRVLAEGGEGVILKRADSAYRPGQRTDAWCKVKGTGTLDAFLTGGWRPGENGRAGTVGSVEVAVMDEDGETLPVGFVAVKPELARSYTGPDGGLRVGLAGQVWEVAANGIGPAGLLRHPRMMRERGDKRPADCGPEQLDALPKAA